MREIAENGVKIKLSETVDSIEWKAKGAHGCQHSTDRYSADAIRSSMPISDWHDEGCSERETPRLDEREIPPRKNILPGWRGKGPPNGGGFFFQLFCNSASERHYETCPSTSIHLMKRTISENLREANFEHVDLAKPSVVCAKRLRDRVRVLAPPRMLRRCHIARAYRHQSENIDWTTQATRSRKSARTTRPHLCLGEVTFAGSGFEHRSSNIGWDDYAIYKGAEFNLRP